MAVKRALSWPPPVYVATFAAGEVCRISVGQYEKKAGPYPFERARARCARAIGSERRIREYREADAKPGSWTSWHPDQITAMLREAGPAPDLVDGHFEHDGQVIPDPFFTGVVEPAPKAKVTAFDRALLAVGKLSFDDLARLSACIDARLETTTKGGLDTTYRMAAE